MHNLNSINREGDIKVIPLKELHCHAPIENPIFMEKVSRSIAEFGLQNPIVVVPITIKRWKEIREYNSSILAPPEGHLEDTVFQVRCGNNRVRVAIEQGYDSIDCIVVEKMQDSNALCQVQREQQNDWIHKGEFGKWL